ncbi:hypothetical protein BDV27DRAFT_166504 [Aspergillus caelatus]|uniref:NmrA-like domain-containing protein n=1 Tax=Aspergillus caelatus TaxID=61420 RepID=A0A5N6ZWN1_9EURO|nr:uncharacterized protein BDV27DRAFT_166504 [Aspergillus caelatus]KAE8361987.1 hypothetical protein BDV27DRAFT_166504 [Aspergillus caelatus]
MLKIGIFPASGGLGLSIINHLLNLVPASQLVFIARQSEKLAKFSRIGVTIRKADYDHPETLENAFTGVDVLMLISYASVEIEYRFEVHKQAIIAAHRSGVSHIFYSSLAFGGNCERTSVCHVMGAHLATEEYLATELPKSMTYTAIREGLYSDLFSVYLAMFDPLNPVEEITIPHPGSGPGIAWAKRDELGEATAKLIVLYTQNPRTFRFLNQELLLSGPEALSLEETVQVLGRAIGRHIEIREISADEYASLPQVRKAFTYHGVNLAKEYTTCWEAFRRGETSVVSPLLEEILGREPERFETTVRGMLEG